MNIQLGSKRLDRVRLNRGLITSNRKTIVRDIFHTLIKNDVRQAFFLFVDTTRNALVPGVDRARRLVDKALARFVDQDPIRKDKHRRLRHA